MPLSVRAALAFLPLSAYFFALGIWQGGTRPRVVSGAKDFGMLAFGLGGLIAFGPLGQVAVDAVFPRPSVAAWMAVASLVGLLAMAWSLRARKRLVIYRVEADPLDHAARPTRRWRRPAAGVSRPAPCRGYRGTPVRAIAEASPPVDRGRFRG